LQRQIDAIQDEVDALEANTEAIRTYRDRTLGYDSGDRRREMAKLYQDTTRTKELNLFGKPYQIKYESAALNAMREYYQMNSSGSGYAQELANLKQQREDYIKMYELENDKKNESQDALDEYRNKIAELDEQIRYFAEDIAKELWSIDIKSWADQISDALMSAFENGESAVKAFNDAVNSIMQSVASEMLKIGIIEPMMERLREKLFGKNGVTTTDKLASDPVAESKKVLATIADYFKPGGEGANMVTAAQEYLYGIDNLMQQMGYANGLRNTENANTLSSGIQGTSEETSDLLAGYVNALRQDVAIKRILLNQFITELWPMYVEQVASAVKALNNIDQNVAFIRALLSENGSIYVMIDSMKSHLDNITNGNEQISIK
jgi:DNA-binding ferritin-like protein (Dps family)